MFVQIRSCDGNLIFQLSFLLRKDIAFLFFPAAIHVSFVTIILISFTTVGIKSHPTYFEVKSAIKFLSKNGSLPKKSYRLILSLLFSGVRYVIFHLKFSIWIALQLGKSFFCSVGIE